MEKYRNKISYLSFFLSILIVCRHSINYNVYDIDGSMLYWSEKFVNELTDLVVPMFFALSGFLFYQNYTHSKLIEKWKSRIGSILIPYLLWNGIAFLYYSIINLLPFVKNSLTGSIEPFTIINLCKNIIFGGHNITWFLQNLMIYILICPLFFVVLKNKYGGILLILLSFAAGIFEAGSYGYFHHAVYYLFGAYAGIHFKEKTQQRYNIKYIVISFLLILLTILAVVITDDTRFAFMNMIVRMPIRTLQIVLLWIAADVLAVNKEPFWWMKISFIIYCSHSMILESIEKVFFIVFGKNMLGAFLDFVFAPIITVGIIILISMVVKRIKPLWKLLSGNR